jgi:O-antigen/teichoic acid export membrane protein
VLNVVFIPRYGFQAAAWITLLTEVTVMSLSMREVLRALGMRPRVQRFARVLAAATAMGALVGLARAAGAPLGALAAIAAVSYPLGLLLLHALTRDELVSVLRREPLASAD